MRKKYSAESTDSLMDSVSDFKSHHFTTTLSDQLSKHYHVLLLTIPQPPLNTSGKSLHIQTRLAQGGYSTSDGSVSRPSTKVLYPNQRVLAKYLYPFIRISQCLRKSRYMRKLPSQHAQTPVRAACILLEKRRTSFEMLIP